MFNMSDLSIDAFLDSVALNLSYILPKQNRVGKITFLLSALNLIISFH